MENTNQEKKGRGFWRGFALVVGTALVCYEIFGRKGQDVKKAAGWVKDKVGKKQETQPERNNNQNGRQNNSGWNNNRRN